MRCRGSVACGLAFLMSLLCASCASEEIADSSDQPRTFALPDDLFPIMSWELPPRSSEFANQDHGVKSLADCGFTVAGFVAPKDLPQCEKLGIKAIVFADDPMKKWSEFSDDQISQRISKLVEQSKRSKAVIGYFLTDEPGVKEFGALGKAVGAVKKFAPGK